MIKVIPMDPLYKHCLEAYGIACEESKKSTCKKNHSGAAIFQVSESGSTSIIGKGYNWPTLPDLCCLREGIHGGKRLELCTAIHAEQMAIADCLRYWGSISAFGLDSYLVYSKWKQGSSTFSRLSQEDISCTLCSRLLDFYGLSFVYFTGLNFEILTPSEFNERSFSTILGRSRR